MKSLHFVQLYIEKCCILFVIYVLHNMTTSAELSLCFDLAVPACSPWRIVDDCGGAFTMGAIGGGVFQAIKGFRNAPAVSPKGLFLGSSFLKHLVSGHCYFRVLDTDSKEV